MAGPGHGVYDGRGPYIYMYIIYMGPPHVPHVSSDPREEVNTKPSVIVHLSGEIPVLNETVKRLSSVSLGKRGPGVPREALLSGLDSNTKPIREQNVLYFMQGRMGRSTANTLSY